LRLSQILLNLLGNAVKFTAQGSVTLEIGTRSLPSGALLLDCAVRDTGIGMDARQQENILKPFTQADSSTARKFGGTGLGLSISKALVELMGGEIVIKSESGKGSEFSFFIKTEPYEGASETTSSATQDDIANRRYEGFTILVAEDNEINQEIAEALLSEMGFSIDIAEDGEACVRAFAEKDYDLIFMDIRMPVMDGLAATREIRRIERERAALRTSAAHPPRVPIIAMTANAMQEDRDAGAEAGMDGHISKPISIDEIRSVLYRTLIAREQ
jgi:CheY-like chemotaxis protein